MTSLRGFLNRLFPKRRRDAPLEDLEENIERLQDPFDGPAHEASAKQAARYLLAHADAAHPLLLELLLTYRASNPIAVIDLLPRFGRQESVPVLKKILAEGLEHVSGEVAAALARHPSEKAFKALESGLSLPAPESIKAAADGLMSRGDAAACPALRKLLGHENPEVRYHVIQAAGRLGCLDSATLRSIAQSDQDSDIVELTTGILQDAPQ